MVNLIFIALFVFCAAVVAAAILIAHEQINTYDTSFHRHYFYYLAAFYAFAVYGVGGQLVVRELVGPMAQEAAVVDIVITVLPVLGIPFLFVSWLMLINMGYSLYGARAGPRWMLGHTGVFLAMILAAWLAFRVLEITPDANSLVFRNARTVVLVGLEALYLATFLVIARRSRPHDDARPNTVRSRYVALMAAAFAVRSAALPLTTWPELVAPVAILIYFASNLAPLLYLRAHADQAFEPVRAEGASDERIDAVFERYGITPRERQIVREICLGKTNQQIADALFISLQTVKDHTHRIYSKMGVRSRVQLVQKVAD